MSEIDRRRLIQFTRAQGLHLTDEYPLEVAGVDRSAINRPRVIDIRPPTLKTGHHPDVGNRIGHPR